LRFASHSECQTHNCSSQKSNPSKAFFVGDSTFRFLGYNKNRKSEQARRIPGAILLEPVIRIKEYVLKTLSGLLAPGEPLMFAIPYGGISSDEQKALLPQDRNYLLITDSRILSVKGRYLKDKCGFKAYPRRLVIGASFKHFLNGCNITINFRNEMNEEEDIAVEFQNCGKLEAEAIVEEINAAIHRTSNCPACMQRLTKDYTFCPHCGAALKKLCSRCGKPKPVGADKCPICQ